MPPEALTRRATSAVLIGAKPSSGAEATIVTATGTRWNATDTSAVHVWSCIDVERPQAARGRAFGHGSWAETFARRNPQSR